ncbi:hypothetical protein EDD16DRAFT_167785 [Pisolithus croceorrhizus]|nr:hypothetical protein EDD16DRAFT_167785 [Pisolithus croceorrhizus]
MRLPRDCRKTISGCLVVTRAKHIRGFGITSCQCQFGCVEGASASSPTFASIISMVNNTRIGEGKEFLNPWLYPWVMRRRMILRRAITRDVERKHSKLLLAGVRARRMRSFTVQIGAHDLALLCGFYWSCIVTYTLITRAPIIDLMSSTCWVLPSYSLLKSFHDLGKALSGRQKVNAVMYNIVCSHLSVAAGLTLI